MNRDIAIARAQQIEKYMCKKMRTLLGDPGREGGREGGRAA
jgi:hypothetical protein